MRTLALVALVCACGTPDAAEPASRIGGFSYTLPDHWAQDTARSTATSSLWAPEQNTRGETLVIRVTPSAGDFKTRGRQLSRTLLASAVRGLPGEQFGPVAELTTRHGLPELRIEGHFAPTGAVQPYVRIHALVLAPDQTLHVIYTAKTGDAALAG